MIHSVCHGCTIRAEVYNLSLFFTLVFYLVWEMNNVSCRPLGCEVMGGGGGIVVLGQLG